MQHPIATYAARRRSPSLFRDGRSTWIALRGVTCCLFGLLLLTGCTSQRYYIPPNPLTDVTAGPHVYTARALPPELHATPIENAQVLDLTRLAGAPTPSQRIAVGDILAVSVSGGFDSQTSPIFVRVADDGSVELPLMPPVRIAGLETLEAEGRVAQAVRRAEIYTNPRVNITFRQRKTNRVTIVGAVNAAGKYDLNRDSSYLLDAIVAAGDLAENAGMEVEIRRPHIERNFVARTPNGNPVQPVGAQMQTRMTTRTQTLDLAEAVNQPNGGPYLEDGAVVMIEKREPPPLHVMGLVRKPAQYTFPVDHDVRLLGAIAMAGGESNIFADKVVVIRGREGLETPVVIKASLYRAKRDPAENIRLEPGDVVAIERTPLTIAMDMIGRVGMGFTMNPLLY